MNVRHSRLARLVALTVVVSMPVIGMAGVASAKKVGPNYCHNHPLSKKAICTGSSTTGGTGGAPPGTQIEVTVDPNPLIETGQSEIHAVIQVETLANFAGDVVDINSSQLVSSCTTLSFETVAAGLPPQVSPDNIAVVLDDDGNATVVADGFNCAPGTDFIEADLEQAPYLTALTQLVADPPVTTLPGVTGYPNPEVETGDTNGGPGTNGPSGNSDVYAVIYVEDNPVYAEQTVEIGSSQLEGRCGLGWTWEPGNGGTPITQTGTPGVPAGVNVGPEANTTLDDDGNAVFVFKGISCAAGDSTVIADVKSGTHDTFVTTYTITAPEPTI